MKKFISKILFFLIPTLIISYSLDYVFSYYLSQSNSYKGEYEVWNDIYSSNANCDIAIYGSSRAWVHIDPEILSNSLGLQVYNFGIDGHNFWLQYLRHIEFIKYNQKPATIILSVDIFSLQKRKDLYLLDQFLPYMLMNSSIKDYTSSYLGYNISDYYIPLIRYFGKYNSLSLIRKSIIEERSPEKYRKNGFLGMDREWSNDLEIAKETKEVYEIETDSASIVLFEKFIKECQANNIELILVYTPEFIDGQTFVLNRSDVINIYKNFATKYSLKFYDYSNDSICLDKSYFYNASHLNKKGAEKFSKDFANKLKARTHNKVLW